MSTPDPRSSIHVYNARCALTVEPSRNRRGDRHTANLETAARRAGTNDFDWERKIVVQLTEPELPDVLAVLLGHLPDIEFRYHGAARDKGFRLFHDEDRLVLQLFAGSRERHTVTLSRPDRLRVVVLLFRQLQRNHGGVSADVLHAMLTSIYAPSPPGRSSAATIRRPSAAPADEADDGVETGSRAATAASADTAGPTGAQDAPRSTGNDAPPTPAARDDAYDW